MAQQINITVQDGVFGSLDAAKISAIVTAYNQLAAEFNILSSQFNATTKTQSLVIATKSSLLNITADGVARGIPGWSAARNVGSLFDAANGILTIAESGTYRIEWKSLITATIANFPRAKQWLSRNGTEIALDEQAIAPYQGAFRQSFAQWFQGTLNIGDVVILQNQAWVASGTPDLKILGDANTMILIDRIL
jgi:hypothetical protein